MLDIKFIRDNEPQLKEACLKKGIDTNLLAQLLKIDQQRRELIPELENLQALKNSKSKEIAQLDGVGRDTVIATMQETSQKLKVKEESLKKIQLIFDELMLLMPSIPLDKVPVGKDDTENVVIRKWGEPQRFDYKDHVQIGKDLDIIDIPRGVKIAGSRYYFLKGAGARLEWAVLQYTIDHLIKKGFTPMIVPVIVKEPAMIGTSYFPGGEDQAYHMTEDDSYLVGTAEVSLTSYHTNEILDYSELPKRYCALSPCFRREAGTYGKDTHGLYRIHQFQKVEQVVICPNDPKLSEKYHNEILNNAEEVLQALELPYRVVDVCTGDMGQGQVYKNDIETWMPSRNSYGETHSCSTFYDFQSRRLKIRYKDKDGQKKFCHTLNNTCIASPRILIPILENYQNTDGTVTVPNVLRPYMNNLEIIKKAEHS